MTVKTYFQQYDEASPQVKQAWGKSVDARCHLAADMVKSPEKFELCPECGQAANRPHRGPCLCCGNYRAMVLDEEIILFNAVTTKAWRPSIIEIELVHRL